METIDEALGWQLFSIGGTPTTLGTLLAAVVAVLVALALGRLARKAVESYLHRLHPQDDEASRAYGLVPQLVVWFIGVELALHLLDIHLGTLLAASGFLALGAGFAAKNVVENFLSGGILRIEKTIRPKDLIVVDGRWLIIERTGLRTTSAFTYEGEQVLIPNAMIAQAIVENLTRHGRLHRIQVQVGVAYESDLELVRKVLEHVVDGLGWRSKKRQPVIYLREFADSSVVYDVDVWIDDANETRSRRSALHEAVWKALMEEGITIAYPQLDLHLDREAVEAVAQRGGAG